MARIKRAKGPDLGVTNRGQRHERHERHATPRHMTPMTLMTLGPYCITSGAQGWRYNQRCSPAEAGGPLAR